MAKKKISKPAKKTEKFYEALPAAQMPAADFDRLAQLGNSLTAAAKPVMRQAAEDLGALGRDIRHYTAVTTAKTWNRSSRRLYASALAIGGIIIVGLGINLAAITFAGYARDISNPALLLNHNATGTTILDRNGQVLFQVYGATDHKEISIDEVPKPLVQATLAAEDPDFYNHPGFSWRATARALYTDALHRGKVQGGSTITQQLVKNSLLTSQKSYVRKYQEILLASDLEHHYSKDQILSMYLSKVYYGQGSYGVETAAQTYFHKPAKDLDLSESATLAGLPLGPSRFDPNLDQQTATDRRNFVIDQMLNLGDITPDQAAAAKAEPLVAYAHQININAPHFVFYVLDQLRQQYGDDLVEHGGITVTTSLDLNKQQAAENIVKQQINRLNGHHATNGGVVAMNPKTGDILTMVGSVDYDNPDFGKVNVTLSDLQPGSSFKPIAYATAFKKGWSGATQVDDKPMAVPSGDGTVYKPQDYDGKWRGPVLLRRALANSLNIPAIHVLEFAGIHDTIQTAHDMGITTLNDEGRYGLSLVLGGGEVRPIDMATVYGTFANGGVKVLPRAILSVTDRSNKDITKDQRPKPQSVLDARLAYMITNILSDNGARTEEFGANSPLKLSHTAAAKTGTTNDFRDNWTVGYTPDLVTAVWVGNNDHSPMSNVDGITGAAPIWHDYMEMALKGTPNQDFSVPAGVSFAKVCSRDGGLANPWDNPSINEVFLASSIPTKHCSSQLPKPAEPPKPKDQPADQPKPQDQPKNPDQANQPDALPQNSPNDKPHGNGNPFFQ